VAPSLDAEAPPALVAQRELDERALERVLRRTRVDQVFTGRDRPRVDDVHGIEDLAVHDRGVVAKEDFLGWRQRRLDLRHGQVAAKLVDARRLDEVLAGHATLRQQP
jgi:hypothetical protein